MCDILNAENTRLEGLVLLFSRFEIFAAMVLSVYIAQSFIGYVRINLRSHNIFVAEKFLNAA